MRKLILVVLVLSGCTVTIRHAEAPDAMNMNLALKQLDRNDQLFKEAMNLMNERISKLEATK